VLVSRAAQPEQQVRHTTLWHLGSAPAMEAPSLLLAGWAVGRLSAAALESEIEASLPA
jgi:hypothetical protein